MDLLQFRADLEAAAAQMTHAGIEAALRELAAEDIEGVRDDVDAAVIMRRVAAPLFEVLDAFRAANELGAAFDPVEIVGDSLRGLGFSMPRLRRRLLELRLAARRARFGAALPGS